MEVDIAKKFLENIAEIDGIFEVATSLKSLYSNALRGLASQQSRYSEKKSLENTAQAIENISNKSIAKNEKLNWEKLYTQAIVLIVSNSEQLLKHLFENLLFANLKTIRCLEKMAFSFQEIQEHNFNLTLEQWQELIWSKIYGEGNPKERINFQNIQSIIGIFDSYFGIKITISDELSKKMFLYYQYRHVLVHNGGVLDRKFCDTVNRITGSNYQPGQRLEINSEVYLDCKKTFIELFDVVERAVKATKLNYAEYVS